MRRLLAGALLVVPLSFAAGAAPARPVQPHTLVATRGKIFAFAQDGGWMGWIGGDARVRVRRLSTGRTTIVGKVDRPERASTAVIAMARSRALWAWDSGGNNVEETIATGAPGAKARGVDLLQGDLRGTGGGERFSGVAGDGATLAYGWVAETCVNRPFGCDVPWTDPLVVTGGGVVLVGTSHGSPRAPAIAEVAPPAILGVGQGHLAVVPARSPTPPGMFVPRVAEDGPVSVSDLGGRLKLSARLDGIIRDVALFRDQLVVLLEQPDGSRVIRRFDAESGEEFSRSRALPPGTVDVSAGSGGIVFRVGAGIYVLHGSAPKRVARAAGTPIGLSIEGRRIAWAENVSGHGRIRAVTLP